MIYFIFNTYKKAPTIQSGQIPSSRVELMIPATKIRFISIDVYKMRYYFYSIELFRFSLVIVDKDKRNAPTFASKGTQKFFYYES